MIRHLDVHKSLFLGPLRLAAYVLLFGCFLVGLSYSSSALAGTITLSTNVSSQLDPNGVPLPDPIDVADLDATFDFNITDPNTLELTVTNLTSGDELFDINEVFFNASSNVTGLEYNKATHSVANNVKNAWSFVEDDGTPDFSGTHGDGFGIHDFALIDGSAPSPKDIGPTESITFKFTISGTGPFAMSDFTTTFSRNVSGGTNIPTLAVAKFVRRRDSLGNEILPNDSGFGGNVPEPGSAMLLALGALSLLGYRGRCALL
ncbi:MAG: hypothetical protein IH898_06535 [Planctomycetes bacterium]|nr:hypothetical protein [Planctomycetota bacterium]